MLENSRVPIRVDAVSGTLLAEITGRAVEGAAHQFVIVRASQTARPFSSIRPLPSFSRRAP